MKARFLFLVILFGLITGCSKKDDDYEEIDAVAYPGEIDPVVISAPGDVICDDTTGMDWVSYNFMFQATQAFVPVYFNLDANNDLVPDLRLVSEKVGSLGAGYYAHSRIESLNSDTKILGYLESDTAFYFSSSFYSGAPPLVWYTINYYSSCFNVSGTDSIVTINNNFKVSPLHAGDTVNANSYYQSDALIIIDDDEYLDYYQNNVDTINYIKYFTFKECDQFPMGTVQFIGFKTKINSIDKYGWIKLSITYQNRILIHSTAIQK